MVRSMYSGVAGLKVHQTRMDTIGNNIANVNTYGFKSARTTFRDIYYQNISAASGPTGAQGGQNPSAVGYGSKVGGVDLLMSGSTFSMTDQTMDLAIDGDGFFQVQDAEGNTYYTRAGMLNFDAAGNLVDMQGNFVLGVNGDPTGRPAGSERIKVNLPAVNPTPASGSQTINGKDYTISFSNNSVDGNMNFNFMSDSNMTDGVKAKASVSATGIVVTFNAKEEFGSWAEINEAVNKAITEANGGKPHAAGDVEIKFTGDAGKDPFLTAGTKLTGAELASTDFGIQYGKFSITGANSTMFGGITPSGTVGSTFGASATATPIVMSGDVTGVFANAGPPPTGDFTMSMTVGGKIYKGVVSSSAESSGTFRLYNSDNPGDETDFIEMKRPKYAEIVAAADSGTGLFAPIPSAGLTVTAKASAPSRALGLSSTAFTLKGGTPGGTQSLADMTGIAVGPNGLILGLDSQGKEITIGRIDLATFANPAGLSQIGSSNYGVSANSGAARLVLPGTGGGGQLVGGSLELSNVDLSKEFSDMITTQRGYQANSRIITVSDTMLEELINLKR